MHSLHCEPYEEFVGLTVRYNRLLYDTSTPDRTSEISKLLKYSPCRYRMFEKLKLEIASEHFAQSVSPKYPNVKYA